MAKSIKKKSIARKRSKVSKKVSKKASKKVSRKKTTKKKSTVRKRSKASKKSSKKTSKKRKSKRKSSKSRKTIKKSIRKRVAKTLKKVRKSITGQSNIEKQIKAAPNMTKLQLTKLLKQLDDAYYNVNDSGKPTSKIVSDVHYDMLRDIYEERFGPWNNVGAKVNKKVEVKLPYWLGSMDKYKPEHEKEINDWIGKFSGPYMAEDKLDGVSGLLTYDNSGKPKFYTRGDGRKGTNITHLVDILENAGKLPKTKTATQRQKLKNMAVRGELIMKKQTFASKFSSEYQNARNMTAGVVNAKDPKLHVLKELDFVVYEVIKHGADLNINVMDQMKLLKQKGFDTVNHKKLNKISVTALTSNLESFKKSSKYEIDGMIITDMSKEHRRNTTGNPKYAFAFKMMSETKKTTVTDIEWETSRRGLLIPVIKLKPVKVSGVTIRSVNGHNARYVVENKIGIGSEVIIMRSGEVIPYIVSVEKTAKPAMPTDCEYEWDAGRVNIKLKAGKQKNNKRDNEMIISSIYNFFKKLKAKGIAKKTIEKIYNCDLVTINQIITADPETYQSCGFGSRQSDIIYEAIQGCLGTKKQPVDLAELMEATSIFPSGQGKSKFQILLDKYPGILTMKLGVNHAREIAELSGWSDVTAKEFLEKLPEFKKFLKENKQIIYEIWKPKVGGTFEGMVVLFTGFRDAAAEKEIKQLGGKISTSVSKNVTLLVASDPDGNSSKLQKARELGVKIISRDELDRMLG